MAVQQVQNLPAQFIQDLGQDLAKQIVAQSGVPVVATRYCRYISQQAGESAADFAARQSAAQSIYNKTTKFSWTCTTSCRSRCITTTSTTLAQARCWIFSTIFNNSTNKAGTCFWFNNIRWNI